MSENVLPVRNSSFERNTPPRVVTALESHLLISSVDVVGSDYENRLGFTVGDIG